MNIGELKDGINDFYALIKNIQEKRTKINSPFLNITLMDNSGEVIVKLFNTSANTFNANVGDIIFVSVEKSLYNGSDSLKVLDYRLTTKEDNLNKADFLTKLPVSTQEMYDTCVNEINDIKNPELKSLCLLIFTDFKEKIMIWGAAKTFHHNIVGGWLWHTYRMVLSVKALSSVYVNLNSDLLIAGTLLHDIGKLTELETNDVGASIYTVDGELFGHSFLGAEIVKEYAKNTNLDDETLRLLMHIIVSHHGKKEFGATVEPAIPEAMVINHIDYIDSRMYCFEDIYKKTKDGELADGYVDGNIPYKTFLK